MAGEFLFVFFASVLASFVCSYVSCACILSLG